MFDGETVLTQVRQGIYASDWQIFHGRRGLFLTWGLLFGAMGLIGLFIIISSIVTFTSYPSTQGGLMDYFSDFGGGAILILSATILVFNTSVSWLKQAFNAPQQLLIIMQNGVVECENSGLQPTRVIRYADTERVELHTWQTRHRKGIYRLHIGLIMHDKDGGKSVWELDERFGAPDMIAQTIIASQARYAALHDNASV